MDNRQYVCWLNNGRVRVIDAMDWNDAKRWTRAKRVKLWRGERVTCFTQEEKQAVAARCERGEWK
jgi:hypothetical protein